MMKMKMMHRLLLEQFNSLEMNNNNNNTVSKYLKPTTTTTTTLVIMNCVQAGRQPRPQTHTPKQRRHVVDQTKEIAEERQ